MKNMMRSAALILSLALLLGLAACGGKDKAKDSGGSGTAATEESSGSASGEESKEKGDKSVDIDLTSMSSTAVYAEVYNMVTGPDKYVGKKVKMKGPFAVYTDEKTKKNYFACIIQDATACCSQGLEFELKGKHDYPDDYPEKNEEITVVGTFDTYEENEQTYSTLRKASIVK